MTKEETLLKRIRQICLELPECTETIKWGHPTFVAGKKMFAALDRYHESWCIAFIAHPQQRRQLLDNPVFFPAPYSAKYGWICRDAEGRINWKEMKELLTTSYRSVASKRMLAALDSR